jgi:hypothetical protein
VKKKKSEADEESDDSEDRDVWVRNRPTLHRNHHSKREISKIKSSNTRSVTQAFAWRNQSERNGSAHQM